MVMVPDGALRTIPMAALYDARNRKFLIEKYPLVTTPGLSLTDVRPLVRGKQSRILLNGISVSVGGFPALPAVREELDSIRRLAGTDNTTLLLDQNFVLPNIEAELTGKPYNVVHIASHGVFEADASNPSPHARLLLHRAPREAQVLYKALLSPERPLR